MRIVNRKEFLSLSSGVLYSQYKPMAMIEGLYQKGDSWTNDWLYTDLLGDVDVANDSEMVDFFDKAELGEEFELDLHSGRRDGAFEDDNMFAVYDQKDIYKLIGRLMDVANKGGKDNDK